MSIWLEVGALVRHAQHPQWGLGQVQSLVDGRVTVNFEHSGKLVLTGAAAELELIAPDWL